jgi:hypothetical protein
MGVPDRSGFEFRVPVTFFGMEITADVVEKT